MTTPEITRSDLSAGVVMSQLSEGYFADPTMAQAFVDIAIRDIVPTLGDQVNYAGFGGGEGYLTKRVADFISASGRRVSTLVVDANPSYLATAKELGLAGLCADLAEVVLRGYDLITMRSVNHYNALPVQQRIVNAALMALVDDGYLVSQNLSGPSERYCQLASQLSKIPALGRVDADRDEPHMTSEAEFVALMQKAGFEGIRVAGYAPLIEVGPTWYWNRFNEQHRELAMAASDSGEVEAIDERREVYFREANEAISTFLETATATESASIRRTEDSFTLDLNFPIFVGRRHAAG